MPKISSLSTSSGLNTTDVVPIVQSGNTVKTTVARFFDAVTGFFQSGSGATARTLTAKLRDVVSVKDFGAVGDGVANDLSAFVLAAAASKAVYVPAGTYKLSGSIPLTLEGSRWYGDGTSNTILTATSANAPVFSITSGLTGVTLENMQLTRSIAATVGGNGITCTGTTGLALFRRLLVQNQYVGIAVGPTDYSTIRDTTVQRCISHGLSFTNSVADGAVQWSLDTVLSQLNGGSGFNCTTVAGPSGLTLGTWVNIATYANSNRGILLLGSNTTPINDFRMIGGFMGNDAFGEIYFDTYGRNHKLDNVFVELAGVGPTGPTFSTAATNLGCGVESTTNNINIQFNGCLSDANSQDGYYLNSGINTMNGCTATNNGVALVAGRRNGVKSTGGTISVTGGNYGNTGAGTTQQYGVFMADGNSLSIVGGYYNNTIEPYSATFAPNFTTAIGLLPNTNNTLLNPQGGVCVGGITTGGAVGSGTINVAGGLLKNNVAYTNP